MSQSDDFLASVDRQQFSTQPYVKRVPKPWGFELHFTAEEAPYVLKVLHIRQGCRLSLQAHDQKTESWIMRSGRAAALLESADGELQQVELQTGAAYTTQVGQRHRLIAITDCEIVEASTPEIGTTWRLADDYGRPDETDDVRRQPDRGWAAEATDGIDTDPA